MWAKQRAGVFRRTASSLFFLVGLMLVATACDSEIRPPDPNGVSTPTQATLKPDPNSEELLPPGWIRTQVRAGLMGRHTSNPLVGFTIALPPGWRVGETWADGDVTNGWIAAPPRTPRGTWSRINYHIGYGAKLRPQALKEDPRYEIFESEVLGVNAVFRFPAPDAGNLNRFDAYFEHIPGAPGEIVAPRVDLNSSSLDFGFENPKHLETMLKSIRYEELESLPNVPGPVVTPSEDWTRKTAGSDGGDAGVYYGGSFSLRLPPGWTTIERRGIDGAIGKITGDGIELSYNNPMSIPSSNPPSSGSHREPPHVAWEEFNDGLVISLVRPVSPIPDDSAITGVMIHPFYDGPEAGPYAKYIKMSILGKGLDEDQQETVLAIFRTIETRSDVVKPANRLVPLTPPVLDLATHH